MDPKFNFVGLASGEHPKYRTCVVLVLAHNVLEGSGSEAIHLKTNYEKSGHDQFGVGDKIINFKEMQKKLVMDMRGDANLDWVPGAVSLRTDKQLLTDETDGSKKTIFSYIYTMKDGSLVTKTKEVEGHVHDDNKEVVHNHQILK